MPVEFASAQVSLFLPKPLPTAGGSHRVAAPTVVEDEEGVTAQLMAVQSWGYHGAPQVQGEELRVWHTRISLTVRCSCA